MGTGEEIVALLRGVHRDTRAILITFSNEASYRMHGPIFWHVAHKLPEIVVRIQRRRFEQLVDALTELSVALPGAESAASSDARVKPAKGAPPTTSAEYTE